MVKILNFLINILERDQTGFFGRHGCNRKHSPACVMSKITQETLKFMFRLHKLAYNKINSHHLYPILKEKDILSNNEVYFLQGIHDALYFSCGG
jgi:hypothetical protein